MAKKKALTGKATPTPRAASRPLSAARPRPDVARRTAAASSTTAAPARPARPVRPEGVPRHTGDRRPSETDVAQAEAVLARAKRSGVAPLQKVRAKRMGFYDHKRRRVGDVFGLKDPKHFTRKWMEKVSPETPDKITTGQEELRQKHDEILGARMEGRSPATQSMETLDDDVDNPLDE